MASQKQSVTISVTSVTVSASKGRRKTIRVNVNGQDVRIPVSDDVYAYWNEQFVRENPTPLQRKRFATFMSVLREAYLKGVEDGKNRRD